jgi:hypothetical protein
MKLLHLFENDHRLIYVTVGLTALLLVLAPVVKTINLYTSWIELNNKLNSMAVKLDPSMRQTMSENILSREGNDHQLLELLGKSSAQHQVIVRKIEVPKVAASGTVEIESQEIMVEGHFINILKALENVSDGIRPTKISSIAFKTERVNKENVLTANIVFQSVKMVETNE